MLLMQGALRFVHCLWWPHWPYR